MAHKIGVIEPHSGEIREHMKKSAAHALVRRLLAEWVIYNVSIRRLAISEIPLDAYGIRAPLPERNYIPLRMPPAEIPNTRFREPQSAAWKLARNMILPSQQYRGEFAQ